MRFVIFLDRQNLYRWHLKAANGEIVATSESYVSKQDAKHSIDLVRNYAQNATIVDIT